MVASQSKQLWCGKDYVNWIQKDCVDMTRPFEDLVDRKEVPRMPWHDIACSVYGRSARDVGRHFIQRWNAVKFQKQKNSSKYPYLIPKSYDRSGISRCVIESTQNCSAQILRSSCEWSAGISNVESSIYNAYINAISTANHYIYIENQFFISRIEENDVVENGILEAIVNRIMEMHEQHKQFRVYIVLPLLPAFEGDVCNETGSAIKTVMHYQMRTLNRSDNSLMKRLSTLLEGVDPSKYVCIASLRTYGRIGNSLKTELIYVHSKLMIVDDAKVIIGSANVNDRSMKGSRDSELAVLLTDNHHTASRMNDKPHRAGIFAYHLRVNLMCEHLGLDPRVDEKIVQDPICDEFYNNVWYSTASENSSLFSKVFNCYPENDISTIAQLKNLIKQPKLCDTDPDIAKELTDRIKGNLVLFPLDFLCEEDLRPAIMTKENLVPQYLWT